MGKVVNGVKLAIPSKSDPHFGEKLAKWPKLAILSQSKPLFWLHLPLWVILSWFSVKWILKVEQIKIFADVPPPQWKLLRFLLKWDTLVPKDGKSCEWHEIGHSEWISASFWGKTGKQNWPFWANLSHFFSKIHHCGSFWAGLVWKESTNLKKSKYLLMFEISAKMRYFGGKRWDKLWMAWNWPFQVNMSLILGKNLQNVQNWPFWANITHFFSKICHCRSFWATLVWKELKMLKNSIKLPMSPPRNENHWNFS